MKHLFVIAIALVSICFCSCENNQLPTKANNTILPRPEYVEHRAGYFHINENTKIQYDSIAKSLALDLSKTIKEKSSCTIVPVKHNFLEKSPQQKNFISLQIDASITGTEAYSLEVSPHGIVCKAANTSGLRYGVETLLQLYTYTGVRVSDGSGMWIVPAIHIKDKATQAVRSIVTQSDILKDRETYESYIHMLSRYKINSLRVEFPKDLWLSDDLVSGQTDSIRSLLLQRYDYAASKGVELEADVNFVDLLGMELIKNSGPVDTTSTGHSMKSFPAVFAIDLALPMLERITQFFPFEKINLGDPELNNMGYFCELCVADTVYRTGLLDSIAIHMKDSGIDVAYAGVRMSYKEQLNLPIALGEGINYVFIIDLNAKETSLFEVYQKRDQENKVYCLESKLEEKPQVSAAFLAYADRMWGQYGDYTDFMDRIVFHSNIDEISTASLDSDSTNSTIQQPFH